jgi:hypothetical protein
MSNKQRRKETKELRNNIPKISLLEMERRKMIRENFHLSDSIDMKEYQLQTKTDWWKKMITN